MRFIGFLLVLALIVGLLSLGPLSLHYVVGFWSPYIVHHVVHIPLIPDVILGLVFSETFVPAALITWFISFFI